MPPLTDAVGFVDGQEADVPGFQVLRPILHQQAFRGGVKHLELALVQPPQPGPRFLFAECRVQICGRDPADLQRIHLILHQRDQR